MNRKQLKTKFTQLHSRLYKCMTDVQQVISEMDREVEKQQKIEGCVKCQNDK